MMSIEILIGLIAFAALLVTWALVPGHKEPDTRAVAMRSTAS